MPSSPTDRFFAFLRKKYGYTLIAGVDEVGCGCLAGPVVAAAVVLPAHISLPSLRDSKLLSAQQRSHLAERMRTSSRLIWNIGSASVDEIDELGIRPATLLASQRALLGLSTQPDAVVSDAFFIPGLPFPCHPLVRADQQCRAVAAASIIAKVHRDEQLEECEKTYPGYGFRRHKGYGTKEHIRALNTLGPCALHRRTFAPVQEAGLRINKTIHSM